MYCTTLGYHVFVNLPLVGLAFSFDLFLPLAVASLTLSLGTCVAAAFQAVLSPSKRRFWSRPLVALLFFLQPLVRDWARFKSRAATKSNVRVEIVPPPPFPEVPASFTFWSDGSIDRLQFLHAILARLDSANWLVRLDTGWTAHDFELLPSTWVRLLFSTATEELELGKKHFRCRITSRWSSLTRILSGLLAIGVALLIFLFAQTVPWIWFSLIALPLAAWFFESECAFHKFLFTRLLDDTASAHKMVRLKL